MFPIRLRYNKDMFIAGMLTVYYIFVYCRCVYSILQVCLQYIKGILQTGVTVVGPWFFEETFVYTGQDKQKNR